VARETDARVRHLERAYGAFCRRVDDAHAALAAICVCLTYRTSVGNHTASRGWLGRADRLIDDGRTCAARRLGGALPRRAAADTGDAADAHLSFAGLGGEVGVRYAALGTIVRARNDPKSYDPDGLFEAAVRRP
jgi:hypothetical protein